MKSKVLMSLLVHVALVGSAKVCYHHGAFATAGAGRQKPFSSIVALCFYAVSELEDAFLEKKIRIKANMSVITKITFVIILNFRLEIWLSKKCCVEWGYNRFTQTDATAKRLSEKNFSFYPCTVAIA